MADEEKQDQTAQGSEEAPAEEAAEEAPSEAPAEEAAPEAPAEEAEPEAPAEEAAASADEEAPEAAEEPPAEETLSPKAQRKLDRSRASAPTRPPRTPEERASERAEARRSSAADRRRYRRRQRERGGEAGTGTPAGDRAPGPKKVRLGQVVSTKAEKTITVRIEVARRHPAYEKVVRRSATLHAHDAENQAQEGDTVRVVETRPLSRTKRWRLLEIVERAR